MESSECTSHVELSRDWCIGMHPTFEDGAGGGGPNMVRTADQTVPSISAFDDFEECDEEICDC
ncbi:hypothetical protein Plim_3566 [Planctopirus limnophila DSM 3776]|uniref:Uncharacterized protein n=1 Tax=Planctopirus limnophila (strain ATCC 43296 / DSM 3776 / IFAM 1008 / Mu 290) TaxID=521674 RepID=D5SVL9_PLAL2|nr:hypothetical protein Plim_3566 [Planctopirus limnophila DSM 3776]